MSEELKPCPFCGSTKLKHRPDSLAQGDVGYVMCCDCLIYASVKSWNTRAPDETVKGVVEALEVLEKHIAKYELAFKHAEDAFKTSSDGNIGSSILFRQMMQIAKEGIDFNEEICGELKKARAALKAYREQAK